MPRAWIGGELWRRDERTWERDGEKAPFLTEIRWKIQKLKILVILIFRNFVQNFAKTTIASTSFCMVIFYPDLRKTTSDISFIQSPPCSKIYKNKNKNLVFSEDQKVEFVICLFFWLTLYITDRNQWRKKRLKRENSRSLYLIALFDKVKCATRKSCKVSSIFLIYFKASTAKSND